MSVKQPVASMTVSTDPSLERQHVEIYTDGGCEPNPGPGGYGAVLLHPKKRAEASGGLWQSAETCCQCRDEVVCRHDNDNQRIAQAAGGVARGFLRTEED